MIAKIAANGEIFLKNEYAKKSLKTLFAIPIYLRSEQDYYSDAEREKANSIESAKSFNLQHTIGSWPQWEFNDIVGYLQIRLDVNGCFRFSVFGIDSAGGYERIPRTPRNRRNAVMWPIDYKNYFDKDDIKMAGRPLSINDSEEKINKTLADFLREMKKKINKENKYLDIERWLLLFECCKMHAFKK